MSEEKPLHVRVAEALGWTNIRMIGVGPEPFVTWRHVGKPWNGDSRAGYENEQDVEEWLIPFYDTEWHWTGPLIEKYSLALWASPLARELGDGHDLWRCNSEDNGLQLDGSEVGPTALVAVCNAILALKEAGKL